jgi:hypothetical protein
MFKAIGAIICGFAAVGVYAYCRSRGEYSQTEHQSVVITGARTVISTVKSAGNAFKDYFNKLIDLDNPAQVEL